jgi:glycosyltransferase involved in cell wall biosynthesis
LNILFFSEQIYPHASGAELATYLHAKLLSESGYSVRIITNKFPGEPSFSQVGMISIYRLPLFAPVDGPGTVKVQILSRVDALFSGLFRKMIKWADVVYVPRFWFSVIPLAKAQRKPVITHLHDFIAICPLVMNFDFSKDRPCKGHLVCSPKCAYCHEKAMSRPLKGMLASMSLHTVGGLFFSSLINLSDAIVCVSHAQRDTVLRSGFFSSHKVVLVHNPIPDIANLPLSGNDFGYFGGLEIIKGFQVLYRASGSLQASSNKPFKIHLTKIRNINREYVNRLEKSGFYVHGRLEQEAYSEMYRKVRTVIVPSIWFETWSYLVVEALLNKRYVIASKIGGMPEVVETCKGVTLVEPGNSEELKQAMNDVLNIDNATLFELGSQNREAFLRRFSNELSLKEFSSVLDRIT